MPTVPTTLDQRLDAVTDDLEEVAEVLRRRLHAAARVDQAVAQRLAAQAAR